VGYGEVGGHRYASSVKFQAGFHAVYSCGMVCRADTGHRTTNGLQGGTDSFAWSENFAMATLFDLTGFDADMLDCFAFSSVRK
jgi:hypothetical protein